MKGSYINKQYIKGGASMKTLNEMEVNAKRKIKKPELLAPAGNLEKLSLIHI